MKKRITREELSLFSRGAVDLLNLKSLPLKFSYSVSKNLRKIKGELEDSGDVINRKLENYYKEVESNKDKSKNISVEKLEEIKEKYKEQLKEVEDFQKEEVEVDFHEVDVPKDFKCKGYMIHHIYPIISNKNTETKRITLTSEEYRNVFLGIVKILNNLDINFEASISLINNYNNLETSVKEFEKELDEILEDYNIDMEEEIKKLSNKDEDGNPKLDKDGNYIIDPDKQDKIKQIEKELGEKHSDSIKKADELSNKEMSASVSTIKLDNLPDNINPEFIRYIEPIIEEG